MSDSAKIPPSEFDAYAQSYDAALQQGLSLSGEDKDYFAEGRAKWLARRLAELGFAPHAVLDFGCGIGSATPFLLALPGVRGLVGTDVSAESLEFARRMHGGERARFLASADEVPPGSVDLAFCNGVFHHIPLAERAAAVACVWRALRPGGLFAFWENNPWNPGTRLVMSRIAFDRDAITLPPPVARRLLAVGGFEIMHMDFLFIFPRLLRALRWIEARLSRWPLGAQYLVLVRKPQRVSDLVQRGVGLQPQIPTKVHRPCVLLLLQDIPTDVGP